MYTGFLKKIFIFPPSFIEIQLTNKIVKVFKVYDMMVCYIYTLWKDSPHWCTCFNKDYKMYFDSLGYCYY